MGKAMACGTGVADAVLREVFCSGDWSLVSARVRSGLKKFITKRLERRPMILPIIMEV